MQNGNSNQKVVTHNNDFTINITSTDGIIDEEALKEQFIRIRRAVEHDDMDTQFKDVG